MSTQTTLPMPEGNSGTFPVPVEHIPENITSYRLGVQTLAGDKLPQELIDKLEKPLPSAAISQGTRGLSSIKPIFITERLNEVFGMGRWPVRSQVIERLGKFAVVRVEMRLLDFPWFFAEAFGGNQNDDLGDAYKGAVSDALGKICAHEFHIARDVYKGDKGASAVAAEKEAKKTTTTATTTAATTAATATEPSKEQVKAQKQAETDAARATVANPPNCTDCKKKIDTWTHPGNGKRYDAADLIKNSEKKYGDGVKLCGECQAKRAADLKKQAPTRNVQ